jgi:predicted DNA-binding transcriptional regulator YafY
VDDDLFVPGPGAPRHTKLARWIDLLAAMLARTAPAPFAELAADVPDYHRALVAMEQETDAASKKKMEDSLKRAFERDKDELREFGVAIEATPDELGNPSGCYRLRRQNFYLPYLCLAVPGAAPSAPAKVDVYGYRALESLTLEPDELAAIVDAAACVRTLGDPLLRADVDSALRKLAVDLPVDAGDAPADVPRIMTSRAQPQAAVFAVLGDAMRRRKCVRFQYQAMQSAAPATREVEPYGLFFLSGHWYLAARDRAREELRNFRLNRISGVKVMSTAKQSPDFTVPSSFDLREHARSRHVWELGEADAMQVVTEFRGDSGPTLAAERLGEEVMGAPRHRRFAVRRPDSFARWVLSFAGEVVIREPASLAADVDQLATQTRSLYDRTVVGPLPAVSAHTKAAPGARAPWQPKGAAAQLRRLLLVMPQITDGAEHALNDLAVRVGTDVGTLTDDLYSLVDRCELPAGFTESVLLYVDADRVSARSNHLRRPMRLSASELCALELGLAVLRAQRPPDEHTVLESARRRLQQVLAALPGERVPDSLYHASVGEVGSTDCLPLVRQALRTRRKLQLAYRSSGSTETVERLVSPYGLVAGNGMLYLVAHCARSADIRLFRMDRVQSVAATTESFERPASFTIDDVMRSGRVFHGDQSGTMLVRYSPRIAPWIAEREGRQRDADGGLVVSHPLADWDWAMRHLLQYGPEAEVLEPAALRDRLRAQLDQMLATV